MTHGKISKDLLKHLTPLGKERSSLLLPAAGRELGFGFEGTTPPSTPHSDLSTLPRTKQKGWLGTNRLKWGAKELGSPCRATLTRLWRTGGAPFMGFEDLKAGECFNARQPAAATLPFPVLLLSSDVPREKCPAAHPHTPLTDECHKVSFWGGGVSF